MTEHIPFIFTTSEGYQLSAVSTTPLKAAGSVVIVHGLGEHTGRYAHTVDALAAHGYAVYAFDARGHGSTGAQHRDLGYFDASATLISDLRQFVAYATAQQPDAGKPFLLGHSMGGLLTLRFATEYQASVRGLIITSPWLDLKFRLPAPMKRIIHLMARAFPRAGAAEVDVTTLSRDPIVGETYARDPLVWHTRVPFRVLSEALTMMDYVAFHASQISIPAFWMYGTADKLVYPVGSPKLFAALGSADKTLISVEGGYHELLNEPDKAHTQALIMDWLQRH